MGLSDFFGDSPFGSDASRSAKSVPLTVHTKPTSTVTTTSTVTQLDPNLPTVSTTVTGYPLDSTVPSSNGTPGLHGVSFYDYEPPSYFDVFKDSLKGPPLLWVTAILAFLTVAYLFKKGRDRSKELKRTFDVYPPECTKAQGLKKLGLNIPPAHLQPVVEDAYYTTHTVENKTVSLRLGDDFKSNMAVEYKNKNARQVEIPRVLAISVFPIKGCASVPLGSVSCLEEGMEWDRRWAFVSRSLRSERKVQKAIGGSYVLEDVPEDTWRVVIPEAGRYANLKNVKPEVYVDAKKGGHLVVRWPTSNAILEQNGWATLCVPINAAATTNDPSLKFSVEKNEDTKVVVEKDVIHTPVIRSEAWKDLAAFIGLDAGHELGLVAMPDGLGRQLITDRQGLKAKAAADSAKTIVYHTPFPMSVLNIETAVLLAKTVENSKAEACKPMNLRANILSKHSSPSLPSFNL